MSTSRRSKPDRLTQRDLNRATLVRQLLLARAKITPTAAILKLAPFGRLTKAVLAALTAEGEALLRFVEPDATTSSVK